MRKAPVALLAALAISSRTQIQPATNYRLCNSGGTQTLCQSPVGTSADTGGAQE